ncbi:unnamed protein product [Urochloa humidicola]
MRLRLGLTTMAVVISSRGAAREAFTKHDRRRRLASRAVPDTSRVPRRARPRPLVPVRDLAADYRAASDPLWKTLRGIVRCPACLLPASERKVRDPVVGEVLGGRRPDRVRRRAQPGVERPVLRRRGRRRARGGARRTGRQAQRFGDFNFPVLLRPLDLQGLRRYAAGAHPGWHDRPYRRLAKASTPSSHSRLSLRTTSTYGDFLDVCWWISWPRRGEDRPGQRDDHPVRRLRRRERHDDEFVPELLLGSAVAKIDFRVKKFEFIPFGSGRRMCPGPGLPLAERVVPLILASLLQCSTRSTGACRTACPRSGWNVSERSSPPLTSWLSLSRPCARARRHRLVYTVFLRGQDRNK